MTAVVSGQWSVVRTIVLLFGVVLYLTACSIPNLEPQECIEARVAVREFYSYHFGNDMTFSPENLEKRRTYLSPAFYDRLKNEPSHGDPFTKMSADDLPKAFRVGECQLLEPGRRVRFKVLLFWKTDTRTEQRAIAVEAVKVGDKWLIDTVADSTGN